MIQSSRVISEWDEKYSTLNDSYTQKLVEEKIKRNKLANDFLTSCRNHRRSGIQHFETIMILNQYVNSGLTIIPKKNMVLNIGLTGEATHTSSELDTLPKGYRRLFMLETYDISDNLIHPKYVIEDYSYKDRSYKMYGWNNNFTKIYRVLESFMYKIFKGQGHKAVKELFAKVKKVVWRR